MIYVNPILGRTGLCNMLFIWGRAKVYAKRVGACMLSPQWTNFMRLGPILRRERNKRYYLHELLPGGSVRGIKRLLISLTHRHIHEDTIGNVSDGCVVDFYGWSETYFESLLNEREWLRSELIQIVNPQILVKVRQLSSSQYIGVHIRRGDFVNGGLGVEDDWYIRAINQAKTLVGDIPIRLFSDAAPSDLVRIVESFPGAEIMPFAPAIQDLLVLSESKVLVGTSQSTFSMWAVFLGQMPSIWRTTDIPPRLYVENKSLNSRGNVSFYS